MLKDLKLKTKLFIVAIFLGIIILPALIVSIYTISTIYERFSDLIEKDAPRQHNLLLLKSALYETDIAYIKFSEKFKSAKNQNQRKQLLAKFNQTIIPYQKQLNQLLKQYYSHIAEDDRKPPFSLLEMQTFIDHLRIESNQKILQGNSLERKLFEKRIERFESLIDKTFQFELDATDEEKQVSYTKIHMFFVIVAVVTCIAIFLAIYFSHYFITSFTNRIQFIRDSAISVTKGEKLFIKRTSSDELGDLEESIMNMLQQLLVINQKLEDSFKKNQSILDTVNDSIITIDTKGTIQSVNSATLQIFGYKEKEVEGVAINQIVYPFHVKELFDEMRKVKNYSKFREVTGIKKDGSEFILEFGISMLHIENKTLAVCAFRNIQDRKEMEATIRYQATFDALTKLPNRVLFYDRLQQAISASKRSQLVIGVAFLDLDRFKIINDSLGHEAGDELLKIIAQRLQSTVRESDTVSRQGGDEFVMMFTGLNNEEAIVPIIKKILQVVAEPIQLMHRKITITASIGISFFPKNGVDPKILLKNADAAMYQSKELGRDTFQFFEKQMNEQTMRKFEMENEMRQSLKDKNFSVYYQPLMDVEHNEVAGAEALIRWIHPTKGIIYPLDFIPLAEETGLIIPLGEWILKSACLACANWNKEKNVSLFVSVNISGSQFKFGDIVQSVSNALKESNLAPSKLELELTESVLIEDTQNALIKLNKLKSLGVSLAIDDFGTGYSSLSYIRRFPINKIKIDSSFISDLDINKSSSELTQTIINLSKNLHLSVLAEGVEKKEQLSFLKQHHCTQAQGFLFSKPLPNKDFHKWLKNYEENKNNMS